MYITILIVLMLFNINAIVSNANLSSETSEIREVVTNSEQFPYVAAIMRKTKYFSAGALIDEYWVLTAADSLFMIRESIRLLRVRLGSANYKAGGLLRHMKYIRIHPYFDDKRPQYDVALVRLSEAVTLNPTLSPIRLLNSKSISNIYLSMRKSKQTEPFVVTSWKINGHKVENDSWINEKGRQYLTVSHLRPLESEECSDQLEIAETNRSSDIICLDLPTGANSCERDIGAPVILNGVLWGVISSWKSEDCDLGQEPIFVNLVSPVEVSSWIHSTIRGHRWSRKHVVDYEDNFI